MKLPYRSRDGREGCIWFAIVLLGIAGQFGLMALLHPYQDQLQAWILPIAAVPFIIMIVVAMWVLARRKKKRIGNLALALSSQGIVLDPEPSEAVRQFFVPHLANLQQSFGLHEGVANLVWVAYNPQILIFEHHYITGSGRYTQEHNHTVIAFAASQEEPQSAHLGYQPSLWLTKTRFGQARLLKNAHGEDLSTGDPEFDKTWAVYGSAETMAVFLTKPVRQRLLASPRSETWQIGRGWVAVGFPTPLDATNLLAFLSHARATIGEL